MIPQETIDIIFETVRIEEIVKDFINLKKAGVNYKGRCPFHDEKTPSFVVSPTKGIYKCFGCGKGGNSINFIQEIQGANYPEALRYIAEKYNIEIVEEKLTKQQEDRRSEKEGQFIATKFACEYFQNTLWKTKEGETIGLSYFQERGFTKEIIKKFNLGYSPKKHNSFEKSAVKAGYDKKILIESGLIGVNQENKTYDKFRERIIFPIHAYSGKVIGFGGRSLNIDNQAKYINSNETLIYDKSKVLYGLYIAKQAISRENKCYIVEGYTDVISMHQNGVENVVSASGTSLGPYQINLIKRSTNNIILLFDGDNAGKKAAIRSINLCLKGEMNVKITSFPEGEDPDSYSKKLTTEKFQEYLTKNSINFVDYLIKIYNLNEEKDPGKIIEIKKQIISSISEIPDLFSREEYCKIYHEKLNISEQSLLQQVNKARGMIQNFDSRKRTKRPDDEINQGKKNSKKEQKLDKQEEEVLRLLINYGNENFILKGEEISVAEMIITELNEDKITFINSDHQTLYAAIINNIKKDGKVKLKRLINSNINEISKKTIDLISEAHNISENWKKIHNIMTGREDEKLHKTTEKAILSLKKGIVDNQIANLQKKLMTSEINEAEVKRLRELTRLKTEIAKILGRNIG
tara:strand:+ start:1823 stop:3724 length:1902 start_codon:yes stop_codon:yes gene_type:complete